jgi:uncharacterized protein with HEPN domain
LSREPRVFLDDMLESADKIAQYVRDVDSQSFRDQPLVQDAVVRNLEVIGEAAKHVPKDIENRIVGVEWRKIAGMRDILIHEYFGIDLDVVWDAATVKVPELAEAIREYLGEANL